MLTIESLSGVFSDSATGIRALMESVSPDSEYMEASLVELRAAVFWPFAFGRAVRAIEQKRLFIYNIGHKILKELFYG